MTSFVAAFLARVSPLVFFMASAMAPDRWQKFSESGNISYLYTLDTFDLTIIALYFGLLAILSIYGIYRIRMTYLYWRYRDHSPKPARQYSEDELPKVTIQLPLFNEMYVVERLLESVVQIDYPHGKLEIQVLDDSTDETQQIAAAAVKRHAEAGHNIVYIHRDNREGFKAGALEAGLKVASGELVAIFDADFRPRPDCIRKMVHYFTEEKVGVVQFRWSHINADYNVLTRIQSVLLDGHFVIEHTSRNRSGGFFNFNGTAGMWRRQAIEWSGGWQHDTLTEDTDLSYRAQMLGWKFVYVMDEDVPAELPVEINAFKAQQRRWAKGLTQVAFKMFKRTLNSDLPWHVRIEMFFHLTSNLSYPLMIVFNLLHFPILIVRYNQGLFQMMLLDIPFLLLSTFSVTSFYYISLKELHGKKGAKLWMIYLVMATGVGLSMSNAKAVMEAVFGIKSSFVRTPKYAIETAKDSWQNKKYRRNRGWLPYFELGMALYFILTMVYAAYSHIFGVLPFLSIFAVGYGYVGILSFFQGASLKAKTPTPSEPQLNPAPQQ